MQKRSRREAKEDLCHLDLPMDVPVLVRYGMTDVCNSNSLLSLQS